MVTHVQTPYSIKANNTRRKKIKQCTSTLEAGNEHEQRGTVMASGRVWSSVGWVRQWVQEGRARDDGESDLLWRTTTRWGGGREWETEMDDGEVDAGLGELDGDRRASMAGSCWRCGMSREPAIATSRELAWRQLGTWEADGARRLYRRREGWRAAAGSLGGWRATTHSGCESPTWSGRQAEWARPLGQQWPVGLYIVYGSISFLVNSVWSFGKFRSKSLTEENVSKTMYRFRYRFRYKTPNTNSVSEKNRYRWTGSERNVNGFRNSENLQNRFHPSNNGTKVLCLRHLGTDFFFNTSMLSSCNTDDVVIILQLLIGSKYNRTQTWSIWYCSSP
jgi:hypothetical protein